MTPQHPSSAAEWLPYRKYWDISVTPPDSRNFMYIKSAIVARKQL
jgi:hypothetical protein